MNKQFSTDMRSNFDAKQIPEPISHGFLNRNLMRPWRRERTEDGRPGHLPTSQYWIEIQEEMYKLQTLAHNFREENGMKAQDSPYPQ